MKYVIQITLLVLNILNILTLSKSNLFNHVTPFTCKFKKFDVSRSWFDFKDLLSFFKSQQTNLKELTTVLSTVEKSFEDSFLEATVKDEDIHLNITELIKKYGFEAEEHDVSTDDGYILTMHRIVGDGPVVFIMHGLLNSADDFVTPGSDSLPFLLASEGYDIWLGNGRGTKHSRKHVALSPECEDYWEFSFDEGGQHDLPAMIDYALDRTGKAKLTYVGFSQGTSSLLVLCSELPEYNKKISLAALLAPVAFMSHIKSPLIRALALETNLLSKLAMLFGLNEFAPNDLLLSSVFKFFCGNNPLGKFICSNLLNLFCGFDAGLVDIKRLPVMMAHLPSGGSIRQLEHYGQEILSEKFRKFDFNKRKNQKLYGSEDPPEYPLHEITAPIALFYGGNDWFSNVTDVDRLRENLQNVAHTKFMAKYNHMDLIWAKNLKEEIFRPLLKLIKEYQG